jgi:peroxiredoxin
MKHLLATLACAAFVLAQQPPQPATPPDLERVEQELVEVLARPAGRTIDSKAAAERFAAFFERHPPSTLGRLGYAEAIRDYLARDYESARRRLDAFFEKHDAIRNPDHCAIAGRIYLSQAVGALRAQPVDAALARHCALRAAKLYPDVGALGRLFGAALRNAQFEGQAALRVALARVVVQRELPEADQDSFLTALYGPAPARREPEAPKSLAPFTATALSGQRIDLAEQRGKVVLVDFWATWCAPCLREMPTVVKAYDDLHARGLEVIGVSLDREGATERIRAVEQELGMKWEQIYDGKHWQAALAVANGIHAIPATFLLDRAGKVRHVNLRGEELRRAIEALLDEPAK